ncbi:MAG: ankyrin repeat domain-containing protein [Phycisphaerae bacterium]
MFRAVAVLLLLTVPAVLPGCIVFFREEPYAAPDPEADRFADVVETRGTSLVLADGSVHDILGLDTARLDAFQVRRLHDALAALAGIGEPGGSRFGAMSSGLYGGMHATPQGLLLVRRAGGTRAVASLPWRPYPLMFEWPAISLFPRRIPVPPAHVDVTEVLLKEGLVELLAGQVKDPDLLVRYRAAEEEARRDQRGIWADPTGLLWQAVAENSPHEVRARIAQGADVNVRNAEGVPVLHVAAGAGSTAALAVLLEAGADPDIATNGWTPLHAALYVSTYRPEDIQAVRRLLGPAISPKLADMLESAVGPEGGASAAVALLVGAGADVPAADSRRPLLDRLTVGQAPLGTIALLLDHGADLANELAAELTVRAVVEDRPGLLRHMLERGVDPDAHTRNGHTLLMYAVTMRRRQTAELLLQAGADPRCPSNGSSPLEWARRHGLADWVALLEGRGREQ